MEWGLTCLNLMERQITTVEQKKAARISYSTSDEYGTVAPDVCHQTAHFEKFQFSELFSVTASAVSCPAAGNDFPKEITVFP